MKKFDLTIYLPNGSYIIHDGFTYVEAKVALKEAHEGYGATRAHLFDSYTGKYCGLLTV